ncbi:MAG: glycosyltransferase [Eubacterium sp.]|nr:glycosyltransferase [Eubacterium sp.]
MEQSNLKMTPKVSVVIPVYNVELYVEQCLRSVMNQTLADIEIICIEDAGNDSSADIIKRLMREDSRISLYLSEKNMGLASVRNRGIEKARGEYIYFLDSDDMIREDALGSLYEMAENESLDVCIFAADFIYETEELRKKFQSNPATYKGSYPEVLSGKQLYKEWMKVWDWMPSQPRYFYRSEFLKGKGIRFIDGMLHEDESFAFDVLMNADRVKVSDEAFFIRRFRPASIMSSGPSMKNVESCIEILDHVSEYRDTCHEDKELCDAIDFYVQKLTRDTVRKYRSVKASGKSTVVSDTLLKSARKSELLEKVEKRSHLELYACSSYYHVLIALAKAMTQGIEIDLVLEEHGVETAAELAERLMKVVPDAVNQVFVVPTDVDVDPYEQKETAGDEELAEKLEKYVEASLGISEGKADNNDQKWYERYDAVNVFWDLGYIGTYLNIKEFSYILHEDSLDSYKCIRENRPNYTYIFDKEKREEHKGVIPFGYSPCCKIVEVNDKNGIQIPSDKVRECRRDDLMKSLTDEQKSRILRAFLAGDLEVRDGAVLILTEPFAVTGRLPDKDSQVRLYRKLIEEYGKERQILIKAHPRDDLNYSEYFPEAVVIEKNMPMEVLNFDERVNFDIAVTVTSSVIRGLKYADKKKYLGTEYLDLFR